MLLFEIMLSMYHEIQISSMHMEGKMPSVYAV